MEKETKKILIVEDDTAILDIYKTVFGKFGFEVESASSGKEALSIIEGIKKGESEKPVIVLLDLILPDMDGIDLLKAIKSNDVTKNIKDFLWFLRQSFDNQGFDVFYAEDGEKGLEEAKKENPDLVLIDIQLPKINGIEMAKKIKEEGLNPKMIFLTNLNDPIHISEALEAAGESDYIVKIDVNIDSVVQRVKDKLEIK